MADLSQHSNYSGAYSGLINNLYVTIGILGIFVIGHEVEIHIRRRRGRDGTFQRIPVRIYKAAQRAIKRQKASRKRRNGQSDRREVSEGVISISPDDDARTLEDRKRLGGREGWEFG